MGDAPKPEFRQLKETKGRAQYFTDSEVQILLDAAAKQDDFLMLDAILFSYKTGCRQGELSDLKVSDINWSTNEISLWTKNGKDHFVPITDQTRHQASDATASTCSNTTDALPCMASLQGP